MGQIKWFGGPVLVHGPHFGHLGSKLSLEREFILFLYEYLNIINLKRKVYLLKVFILNSKTSSPGSSFTSWPPVDLCSGS